MINAPHVHVHTTISKVIMINAPKLAPPFPLVCALIVITFSSFIIIVLDTSTSFLPCVGLKCQRASRGSGPEATPHPSHLLTSIAFFTQQTPEILSRPWTPAFPPKPPSTQISLSSEHPQHMSTTSTHSKPTAKTQAMVFYRKGRADQCILKDQKDLE